MLNKIYMSHSGVFISVVQTLGLVNLLLINLAASAILLV